MFVCLPPPDKGKTKGAGSSTCGRKTQDCVLQQRPGTRQQRGHTNATGHCVPVVHGSTSSRARTHTHQRERTRASERERKRESERVCERESIRAHMHKAHQLAPTVISWLRKPRTQTTSSCRHQRQSQHTAPVADVISFVRLLNPKPLSNPKP